MDRLLTLDTEQYLARMQAEVRRVLDGVADAVNQAPDGKVISGSEMRVRDLMAELRQTAFETALQMRIDSTESSFSPSDRCAGPTEAEQGTLQPQHLDGQRAGRPDARPVARPRRGQR